MRKIKTWSDYEYLKKNVDYINNDMEIFLILKTKTKDRDRALEELINNNIGTVHHYALRYKWSNISYEDLVQYGIAGIISAADNFDISKNVKFFTFCTHYIIGRLKRALEQYNNIIRLPAHINLALLRIATVDPTIEISDEELSKFTTERYKLHHLRAALEAKKQKIVDLDTSIFVPDKNNNQSTELKSVVNSLLSQISEKAQIAIQLKYGLNENRIHTFQELDKMLEIDSETVINNAFKFLRSKFKSEEILEILKDE